MADQVVEALIFDLLNWLNRGDRTYEDVMNAWRTSCPKLPIWEEVNDRGLISIQLFNSIQIIRLSPAGLQFLESRTRSHPVSS